MALDRDFTEDILKRPLKPPFWKFVHNFGTNQNVYYFYSHKKGRSHTFA